MAITIDGTTGIAGVDGSASTPAYQGNDTNTGIAFPAADTVTVATGGTERMRIDSSGNVGIGTTSVQPFKVHASRGSMGSYPTWETTVARNIGLFETDNGEGYVAIGAPTNGYSQISFADPGSKAAGAIGYAHATDHMLFRTNATERMRIDSSGNFLVGKTTAGAGYIGFDVQPNGNITNVPFVGSTGNSTNNAYTTFAVYSTSATQYQFYVGYGGTVYARSTSISGLSDVREKENIRDLDAGLTEIMSLQPRRFDWKNGQGSNIAGFVAQEVQNVLPELVDEYKLNESETRLALKMGDMIPTLVNAIQELKAITDTQAQTIAALEAKVTALEGAAQ